MKPQPTKAEMQALKKIILAGLKPTPPQVKIKYIDHRYLCN